MDGVRLTGLWKEKDREGRTYLRGSLSPTAKVMIFPNDRKAEGDDKAPDYYLYIKSGERKAVPARSAGGDEL